MPACLPVGLSDINDTTVLQVVSTSGIYSLIQAGLQNEVENAVLACWAGEYENPLAGKMMMIVVVLDQQLEQHVSKKHP